MLPRYLLPLGLLCALSGSASPADTLSARIADIMGHYVEKDGPGAVIGVVKDGEVVYKGAFGLADLDGGEAMTTDRVFDLASCSKNLTAFGALLLLRRDKIALDDDLRKSIPEIPEYDAKRPIHVIDVMHMVSGLTGYQGLVDSYKDVTNEKIVGLVAKEPLAFPTGSKYEYSNTDYNLLATIVARTSGKSFGEYMRKEVFDPLGMEHTTVQERADQDIPKRVFGYKKGEKGWQRDTEDTPGIVGDGSIFSCVDDLILYDRALRAGTLVPKETLQAAWTSGKLDNGVETAYGFGWEVEKDAHGGLYVHHSGSWNGTTTFIGRWVDKDVTIIVLFNEYDQYWGDVSGKILEAIEED